MIPIKTYEVSIIIWKLRYRILITSLRFYTARKWLDEELFWKEIFQSYNCKIYCPFTLLPWLIKCVYELQVSNKRYSWSSVADRCLKHFRWGIWWALVSKEERELRLTGIFLCGLQRKKLKNHAISVHVQLVSCRTHILSTCFEQYGTRCYGRHNVKWVTVCRSKVLGSQAKVYLRICSN